ncbi:MAG: MFS transporter [Clostridia bacterium]
MRLTYQHTIKASYLGCITQAIINNFAPLLFLTFQRDYHIPLAQITLLVTVNFGVQLAVDLLSAKFVDRIGYRRCIVAAHFLCALGLVCMGILPALLPAPFVGLLCAIVLYAIGGGLIEVLISPIVEACPSDAKASAMSLLHSFYCWGHMGVVLISTAFFAILGVKHWPILALCWALLPLCNAFFFLKVPIAQLNENEIGLTLGELVKNRLFWLLMLLMLCAGASEQGMSQWSSAFAEAALGVSKTVGDLAGPCSFALCMGLSRLWFSKVCERRPVVPLMALSSGLCVVAYLLAALTKSPVLGLLGCGLCGFSVGALWPGTFSLGAKACPRGGTAMFALFALAGDMGCSGGPTLVGMVAKGANDSLQAGLLSAIVFPILMIAGLLLIKKQA